MLHLPGKGDLYGDLIGDYLIRDEGKWRKHYLRDIIDFLDTLASRCQSVIFSQIFIRYSENCCGNHFESNSFVPNRITICTNVLCPSSSSSPPHLFPRVISTYYHYFRYFVRVHANGSHATRGEGGGGNKIDKNIQKGDEIEWDHGRQHKHRENFCTG